MTKNDEMIRFIRQKIECIEDRRGTYNSNYVYGYIKGLFELEDDIVKGNINLD